jgi:glycosyltransferase involved in cell wall biosynthesis
LNLEVRGGVKTFAAIMDIHDVHLTKDVGLIPYGMGEYYGYDAYCISYDNSPYPNLKNVPGLKIWPVKKITGKFDVDAFLFLIKHAKDIDVLNIYHQRRWTASCIFLYAFLNSSGTVYWKLDGGGFDKEASKIKQKIYAAAIKKCKLISTETEENAKIQSEWLKREVKYVPNPYDPNLEKGFRPFCMRKNVILTVGRLGTEQKATEVLMDAFRMACSSAVPKDWKLRLVGPIEEEETNFQKYIDEWFKKYPDMRERVEFAGIISQREALAEEYRQAKIFAFPSRHEGFALSMVEAGVSGDYLIGSDIPSIRAFTREFEFADSVPVDDVEMLAAQFEKCCDAPEQLEQKARKLYEHTIENYSLKSCCDKIQESLNL